MPNPFFHLLRICAKVALMVFSCIYAQLAFAHGLLDRAMDSQQRVAGFSEEQRNDVLEKAYACNRARAKGQDSTHCEEMEREARQRIKQRTQLNHRSAENELQAAREYQRQLRGW